jgi:hypothetical protein
VSQITLYITLPDNNFLIYYSPIELEFTALNENIVIENLETFQKNGFDFDIDANGMWSHKLIFVLI